ncbi:MAG: hypothetical protein ABSC46_13555 [Candidatus Limnocylindrales bacterium]
MTTKKNPDQLSEGRGPSVQRGRYAKLLADGYIVDVTPTAKPKAMRQGVPGRGSGSAPIPADRRSRGT